MAWTKTKLSILTVAIVAAGAGSVWIARQIYVNHDPAGIPGLIGWWKLNNPDPYVIRDTSHFFFNNHHGTPMFNPSGVPGRKGRALAFDGDQQYIDLGHIYLGAYQQLSIACWVKHSKSTWQDIVERGTWNDIRGIGLIMDNAGKSVDFGHFGPKHFVKSKADVQDDQWHHVVGTMAPEGSEYTYSIYVDGELDNTATVPIGLNASPNGWAIGARHNGKWAYRGAIADVRLYDRALTPAEVRRLYKN